MKILHTSDLHIGIRIYEYSMLEEQKHVLEQIVEIARREQTDVTIIAGDVYDRSIGSDEAIGLFDDFLASLVGAGQKVIVISGNHDSAERVAYGNRIMCHSGVFMSPVYSGHIEPIVLSDAHGNVNFYPIPFVRPANVEMFFPESDLSTYSDAMALVVGECHVDVNQRNVAVAHQFITNAAMAGSERKTIGGLDNVDANVFDVFDYVALGHLHGAQNCGSERVRYCGTPLKYSFSEINQDKTVTIVDMGAKGDVQISTVPLSPLRDWHSLTGNFDQLVADAGSVNRAIADDYLRITLTDSDDVSDAIGKLRCVYPHLMELRYDNARTRNVGNAFELLDDVDEKLPVDYISDLFVQQMGTELNEQQRQYVDKLIRTIWKEN